MAMQEPRAKYLEIQFGVPGGMELLVFPVLFQWNKKPMHVSRVHWADKANQPRTLKHVAFGLIYLFSAWETKL